VLTLSEICYSWGRLTVTPDQWLAVADEIRLGRYLIKNLYFVLLKSSSSEATEAVKAVASAIREDHHLELLMLGMEDGFTDGAGVALAEALTTNNTLRRLLLVDNMFASARGYAKASLGARAYGAFGTMLRANNSLMLDLPVRGDDAGDQIEVEHFNQMRIE
jgi:hypothetical protein